MNWSEILFIATLGVVILHGITIIGHLFKIMPIEYDFLRIKYSKNRGTPSKIFKINVKTYYVFYPSFFYQIWFWTNYFGLF